MNGFIDNSGLQVITAPSLIFKIHKSPQHAPSFFQPDVFTSRFLATALTVEIL
jgi:hypothetical protein